MTFWLCLSMSDFLSEIDLFPAPYSSSPDMNWQLEVWRQQAMTYLLLAIFINVIFSTNY